MPPSAAQLRATLWPVVNWALPVYLRAAGQVEPEETPDYFALRAQLLPRVPVIGEECSVPGHWARVTRVAWGDDGKVAVHLQAAFMAAEYLDRLTEAHWRVFPARDPDDWLRETLG